MEKAKENLLWGLVPQEAHPNARLCALQRLNQSAKAAGVFERAKATGNIEGDWVNFNVADPFDTDDDRYNISLDTWKPEDKALMPEFNSEI